MRATTYLRFGAARVTALRSARHREVRRFRRIALDLGQTGQARHFGSCRARTRAGVGNSRSPGFPHPRPQGQLLEWALGSPPKCAVPTEQPTLREFGYDLQEPGRSCSA